MTYTHPEPETSPVPPLRVGPELVVEQFQRLAAELQTELVQTRAMLAAAMTDRDAALRRVKELEE